MPKINEEIRRGGVRGAKGDKGIEAKKQIKVEQMRLRHSPHTSKKVHLGARSGLPKPKFCDGLRPKGHFVVQGMK